MVKGLRKNVMERGIKVNPEYTFRKISRRKYDKFVEMYKAKKGMKEIMKAITISEKLYNTYLQTYENSITEKSTTKENKQEKCTINNQSGRSVWLSSKINTWMVKR